MNDARGGPSSYTVGQLATMAGVSADTVRHYERVGVLPPARRGANGYRRFSPEAVQRVALIQRALDAGFSLADLRAVLRVRDAGGAPCGQVLAIAEKRLAELEQRVRRLQDIRDELRDALEDWRRALDRTPPGRRAGLLDSWAARAGRRMDPGGRLRR
jgi:DNA-binding transcriptional MerR regulator